MLQSLRSACCYVLLCKTVPEIDYSRLPCHTDFIQTLSMACWSITMMRKPVFRLRYLSSSLLLPILGMLLLKLPPFRQIITVGLNKWTWMLRLACPPSIERLNHPDSWPSGYGASFRQWGITMRSNSHSNLASSLLVGNSAWVRVPHCSTSFCHLSTHPYGKPKEGSVLGRLRSIWIHSEPFWTITYDFLFCPRSGFTPWCSD